MRLKDREINSSTKMLLRHKLRPSDLPNWLLRKLIELKRRPEEFVRRSRLLLTRDRWLLADQPSRSNSEMCGPPETLVFHSST